MYVAFQSPDIIPNDDENNNIIILTHVVYTSVIMTLFDPQKTITP